MTKAQRSHCAFGTDEDEFLSIESVNFKAAMLRFGALRPDLIVNDFVVVAADQVVFGVELGALFVAQ
jgi:hypothetical protein